MSDELLNAEIERIFAEIETASCSLKNILLFDLLIEESARRLLT